MAYGNTNVPTGEKNVIERISVNGAEIAPINKKVDIPIPKAPVYDAASESKAGLMSAADKRKLDGIAAGAQVNPTSLPANGGNADTVNGHTVNADVPANAEFTDTTYGLATEEHDGLMSAADKAKLNGIPAGGMQAYTGTASIGGGSGSFKIETAARPKFVMLYRTMQGDVNFNGEAIRCYVTNGSYYISGSNSVSVYFENDGITLSWSEGTDGRSLVYVVLC